MTILLEVEMEARSSFVDGDTFFGESPETDGCSL